MGIIHTINVKVAASPVGRWFRLDGSGHVSVFRRADGPTKRRD